MAELEAEIGRLIREYRANTGRSLTVGTVESATGGRIADRITNVPGSSDYFKGSVVAYNNEIKISLLGVKKATIENYGAVSEQTALEMARGGRKLLDVDICISDTGIAGPSGATPEKPVGLFYLGLVAKGESLSRKHVFPGSREENKRDAGEAGLNMLKRYLLRRLNAGDEYKIVEIKNERRPRTMATEKFTVDGSQVVEKIKELIRQGNIRRVRLIHKGRPLIDIPLTVGVGVAAATALAAPVLAALGAIAALVTECTIEVERIEETPQEKDKKQYGSCSSNRK